MILQMSKEEKLEMHNAFLIMSNIQLQIERANTNFQMLVNEFCKSKSVNPEDILPNGINFQTGQIIFKDKEEKK